MKINKFKPMPLRKGPPLPQILNFKWPWKRNEWEHMPFPEGMSEEEINKEVEKMLDKGYIP